MTVAATRSNGVGGAFPRAAPNLLLQLETLLAFGFLTTFVQVFWPPDTFFIRPKGGAFGESHFYDTTTIVSLYVFLAVVIYIRRAAFPVLLRVAWPILALTLLALVSAYWSDDPLLVIRRTGTVFATTLFAVYLVARGDLGELAALMVKVYAFAMAASFAILILSPALATSNNEGYTHAIRGAFTDKNQLGAACGLGIIFSVYAFCNRFGSRVLAGFVFAAGVVLLKLSESRTPLVMMMAVLYGALVCSALRRRSGIGALIGFALIVVGLAGVAALAIDPTGVLVALGRDPTLTNRTPLWHLVWGYIVQRPWLGYGYETFWRLDGPEANNIWATVHWIAPHAHNAWLELALGLGVVGVFFGIVVWLTVFTRFARIATAPAARHAVFCTALAMGIFLENITEYAFFRRGEILWLLFVVAFVELGREMLEARRGRLALSAAARAEMRRQWQSRRVLA